MTQILKIDVKDNTEEILPPYKAVEHYYRKLQTAKKSWAPLSSCWTKDVSFMFPRSNAQEIAIAQEICTTCPVAKDCLTLALVNQEEYGIWGGYSSKEIQSILKEIKSSFGNVWISWDDESQKLIDSVVLDMNVRFMENNGVNMDDITTILKDRLSEIDFRLEDLKL